MGDGLGNVEKGTRPEDQKTAGPPQPPIGLETAPLQTAGASRGTAGKGRDEAFEGCEDLLHWRAGQCVDVGVQTARGPDVDDAEISVVHFLARPGKY